MHTYTCSNLRVLIASSDHVIVEKIRSAFTECDNSMIVGVANDGLEAAQICATSQPDIVVVDDRLDGDGLHVALVLDQIAPKSKVVLLVAGLNEETLISAARAGAREILSHSFNPDDFLQAVGRMTEVERMKIARDIKIAVDPKLYPRIIVITSPKGGVGTTSIAINLAASIAIQDVGKTILFDAQKSFPDSSLYLNTKIREGLVDIGIMEENGNYPRTEDDLVKFCVVRTSHMFDLIASTSINITGPEPEKELIQSSIRSMKRLYRFIVVDAPFNWVLGEFPIVQSCWRVIIVTNLDELAIIHNTKKMVDSLNPGCATKERIGLLVNKATRRTNFSPNDLISSIGLQVIQSVPYDANMINSCNMGQPIVISYPRSPASKAINELSFKLTETASKIDVEGCFFN